MSEDWYSGSSTTASTGFGFGRGKTWGAGSDGDSAFAEKRPGGGFNNNNSGGSNGWNESSSSGFGAKSNGFGGGSGGGSGGFGTGFGSGSGGDSFSGSGFGGGGGAEKKFGGGGGGGGRACFKCGEDGHMSRECPKGGGGGGGGGGSRACFKCGEDGHMSRECPKSGGGGGGGGKGCFKCGQEGHMSRDCPSGGGGGGGGGGGRACFKCGEDGHMSRECPKSGGGGGGGGRACFKCNQEGHMSRECPNAGSGGGFGSRDGGTSTGGFGSTSSGGGGFGSTSSGGGGFGTSSGGGGGFGTSSGGGGGFGTSSGGGGGFGTSSGGGGFSGGSGDGAFGKSSGGFGKSSGGEDTGFGSGGGGGGGRGGFGGSSRGGMSGSGGKGCFKCGEEGHMSRECPNAESGGGGGGGSGGKGCFKCGEEGHMSRECPNAGSGRSGGGGGGKCFKCQGEGHMARECPNAPPEDPDRPKTERYIPPEDDNEEAAIVHAGINFDKYDDIPVEMSGNNKIQPIASFDEAGLYDMCRANVLSKMKYTKPTPVQKWAIPAILQHRDLMACAQTGSGKTGAFLLPVITNMITERLISSASSEVQEPQCVVVAPTRELATQIQKEAQKFASGTILRSVVIYGGTSVGHQAMQVRKGTHLLVATPGRLMDFVDKGIVSLAKVKYLVLDEADRMLDMGFEPVMRKMVEQTTMPSKGERVTLMFSATFPDEIQKLAADFLNDYLFLRVGRVGGANTDVTQTVFEVTQFDKRTKLCELVQTTTTDRTLVFVETKRNADFLASYLSQTGYPTTSIHGDRLQREREEALRDFTSGKAPVLVATAVAARGLDINDVKHVVNYDLPEHIEEYVHRIGRTGRCGNIGRATSFYDPQLDDRIARALVKVLADAQQEVPEWLETAAQGSIGTGGYSGVGGRYGGTDVRRGGGRGGRGVGRGGVRGRGSGGGRGGGSGGGRGGGSGGGGGSYDGWDTPAQTTGLNGLAEETDENWDS